MGKIIPISLKLNFTLNTLGAYGLINMETLVDWSEISVPGEYSECATDPITNIEECVCRSGFTGDGYDCWPLEGSGKPTPTPAVDPYRGNQNRRIQYIVAWECWTKFERLEIVASFQEPAANTRTAIRMRAVSGPLLYPTTCASASPASSATDASFATPRNAGATYSTTATERPNASTRTSTGGLTSADVATASPGTARSHASAMRPPTAASSGTVAATQSASSFMVLEDIAACAKRWDVFDWITAPIWEEKQTGVLDWMTNLT